MIRIVSPSLLSADFGHLADEVEMVNRSAAEWIHIDVMDGVFVPNISFGFPVLKAVKALTPKFMDVHLMIVEPEKYIKRFAQAGADLVTFHYEAVSNAAETVELTKSCGVKVGVSLKPATPVKVLENILSDLDFVLIMCVEPGFGGQSFIPESYDKIRELRRMIDEGGYDTLIGVDGGISATNAPELYTAGVNVMIAGSAIFRADDPKGEIDKILNA